MTSQRDAFFSAKAVFLKISLCSRFPSVHIERGRFDRNIGFIPDSLDIRIASRVARSHLVIGQPENTGSTVQSRIVLSAGYDRFRAER